MLKTVSLVARIPLSEVSDLKLVDLCPRIPDLPPIRFMHDGSPGWLKPDELPPNKERFRHSRVVVMYRDIRDIAVSYYFQRTLRNDCPFEGSLSEFLREERGSILSCIVFWNHWHASSSVPAAFHWTSYERLQADPLRELQSVLTFCQLQGSYLDPQILGESIEFCSFQNMRQLEVTDALKTDKLRVGDIDNPESYKTRRGLVGGFRDYLCDDDIDYVNSLVRRHLAPDLHAIALAADSTPPSSVFI